MTVTTKIGTMTPPAKLRGFFWRKEYITKLNAARHARQTAKCFLTPESRAFAYEAARVLLTQAREMRLSALLFELYEDADTHDGLPV